MSHPKDPLTYGPVSKEELLARSKQHGYTQPQIVELFRWDYELVSQLQSLSEELVLKGGAAAQLFLPVAKQRGSVDVDIIGGLHAEELAIIMQTLTAKFALVDSLFRFKEYKPKAPKVNLPLKTYDVMLPSVLAENCRIKMDILLHPVDIPATKVRRAETFAVTVRNVKCSTPGALVGDKLLTVAKKTIGIQKPDDYPKQIYDLEMLAFQRELSGEDVQDAIKAVVKITRMEASFRRLDILPETVLQDVKTTMTDYSQIDLSSADLENKKAVNDFQQFYVNKEERTTRFYEWSSRTLRIKFLASLIQLHMADRLSLHEVEKLLTASKSISGRIKSISGAADAKKIKTDLTNVSDKPLLKELRGKPPERLFWQVVTPENVGNIENLI